MDRLGRGSSTSGLCQMIGFLLAGSEIFGIGGSFDRMVRVGQEVDDLVMRSGYLW